MSASYQMGLPFGPSDPTGHRPIHNMILHNSQMDVFKAKSRFKVVVAGRRWGKCVKEDQLIAMADGTYKKVQNVKAGDLVLTVNEDTYAIESREVQHLHDNGVKDTVEVRTRSGKKLVVTPNHPLLANNVWTNAGDLKAGDLLAAPKITTFGEKRLPDHVVDFLAIWLAEGDRAGFTNGTKEVVDVMKAASFKMGVEYTDVKSHGKVGMYWRWRGVNRCQNEAISLLKKYGLRECTSKTKYIPDDIFALPKDQLARFINLFVACDGSVCVRSKNTYGVEISLANERMVRQLADLFAKFGIRGSITHKVHKEKSTVTGKNFESWRFRFAEADSLLVFCDEIGSLGKESAVADARLSALNSKSLKGSVNKYLPISESDFRKHIVKTDGSLRVSLNSWRKQTNTRVSEYRYNLVRSYSDGFYDPLADGEVIWDEVVSVTPAGEAQTYDLTVDGNHNFIAEGLVTHNTMLARASLLKFARIPNRLCWYVAPSYRMAKQIMWVELLNVIPPQWIEKKNETSLVIWLVNGSRIELKGADSPDSLRGVGVHYLVMDEVQDIPKDAWVKVLLPTLAQTGGHAMFIGTPKSYNFLYELYMLGQDPKNIAAKRWKSWQFPTIMSPFIDPNEIELSREDMDEKSFKQEFEASFETMSGRVYYTFDRKEHVRDCPFNPNLPIWVGQDFNIDPMSSCIIQPQPNGQLWVVDELSLPSSNTLDTVDRLEKKFWRVQKNVIIFPDPAGSYRQHARGESDLDIFRERGFRKIQHRKKHPPVADRVNAVCRMLMTANGTKRLLIDRKCKKTIESLEQTMYEEGGRDINKKAGIEHMTDALGYPIELKFPIKKRDIVGVSI